MADYKKRPESHVLEQESIDALKGILPKNWIYDKPTDYGIDLDIQIVEGDRVTGKKLGVQVKATDSLNETPDEPTYSIDLSSLKLYEEYTDPVIIIYAITDKQRSFWKFYHIFAQKYINEILSKDDPKWRLNESSAKNPTRTIKFDKDSLLNNEKPLAKIADEGRFYIDDDNLKKKYGSSYLGVIPESDREDLKNIFHKALESEFEERHKDTIVLLEKALRLHNIEITEKISLLINMGNAYCNLSQYKMGIDCYYDVISLSKRLKEKSALEGKSLALGNIGLTYRTLGDPQKGLEFIQGALENHRKLKYLLQVANDLGNIGLIYSDLGEIDLALNHHEEALSIDREISYRKGEAIDLGNLGNIYYAKNNLMKAFEYHSKSLEIFTEIGYRYGEASVFGNIGLIFSAVGEFEKALYYHNEALKINREIGNRKEEAADLGNIGLIYAELEDYQRAMQYHEDALKIDREICHRFGEAADLGNLGLIYRINEEFDKAEKFHEDALAIYREISSQHGEASQLGNIGLVHCARGEFKTAMNLFKHALAINRNVGNLRGQAYQLGNIANIYIYRGDFMHAIRDYECVVSIFKKCGYKADAEKAERILAEIKAEKAKAEGKK